MRRVIEGMVMATAGDRIGGLGRRAGLAVAAGVTAFAVVVVARSVDAELLGRAIDRAADRPLPVALAVAGFAVAFVLRALAWRSVLPGLSFGQAWSGIHVAVGANHVLPLRLGEPMRVLSVVRRAGVPPQAATASTVTMRAADVLTMVGVGIAASPAVFTGLVGPVGWVLVVVVAGVALASWRWLSRLATGAVVGSAGELRRPGPLAVALAAAAWLAESLVVVEAARWAGIELGWIDAVLVATVAVAAQIVAVAPGGFGTYEAASVAAYLALGVDAEAALVAALGAHGLKTAYALVAGAVALWLPAPGLLGRFRLSAVESADRAGAIERPARSGRRDPADRPIILFLPALNEAGSIRACIARAPERIRGHTVRVMVIDDGSTDGTAEVAAAAGAEVVAFGRNRGLGAAVRVGLAEAVERRAIAVAFCDADGEYPPEELASLVGPILDGDADYVTGSRFLGRIDHMRLHRRIGNVLLTLVLSVVARTRISDGQTGYRAFSPAAAEAAEIIHDFNYAQVLTLDLLAKGFRFREVPISYRFRREGESFIRLGRYLRYVIPAVYRELNTG